VNRSLRRAGRYEREPGGLDRWLLSYADFMTLLCALFAVLYAADLDVARLGSVAASWQTVFARHGPDGLPPPGVGQPLRSRGRVGQLERMREAIRRELAGAIADRRVEIVEDTRGLVLSLPEAVTFPSGSAEVTPEGHDLILKIGKMLRPMALEIAVEGHTDTVPIRTTRYRSNWELSTARACAVVQILVEQAGVDPRRVGAAGYSAFRPRTSNDSERQRARNRRVDIVVFGAGPASVEVPRDALSPPAGRHGDPASAGVPPAARSRATSPERPVAG
jgi:chemotaxis protein MotB